MPSSYTAEVYDGTKNDLQSFALRCARGMTYTIHMRDMDLSIPPRHREHAALLPGMLAARAEAAAEDEKVRVRYAVMRLKVETWEVPEALASLKKFMLQQLDESQRHDCGMGVWPKPHRVDPEVWHGHQIDMTRREVALLLHRISDERQMCEQSNAWIDGLYAALPTRAEEAAQEGDN